MLLRLLATIFVAMSLTLAASQSETEKSYACGKPIRSGYSSRVAVDPRDRDAAGAWPWMGSYGDRTDGRWRHLCGGTLIAKDLVLTAAHCYNGRDKRSVRLGDTDLGDTVDDHSALEVKVDSVFVHPDYRLGQAYFDVAVLRLREPVEFNDYILPICLPEASSSNPDIYADKLVTLTGWGQQTRNSEREIHHLLRVRLAIFSQEYCNQRYDPRENRAIAKDSREILPNQFTDTVMCAGYEKIEVGSCPGDSGSPLVQFRTHTNQPEYVQIGLVHGGLGKCGSIYHPGIYVRINQKEILDFINGFMEPDVEITPKASTTAVYTDDPFCGSAGSCPVEGQLREWNAYSERDCLRRCKDTLGCVYYTYFGGQEKCAGFRTCFGLDSDVNPATGVLECPHCVSGHVTCTAGPPQARPDTEPIYPVFNIPAGFATEALSFAAGQGNLTLLRYIVDNLRDEIDLETTKGAGRGQRRSPLFLASMSGSLEAVKLLVDAGADLETTDKEGFTPLMAAILTGHEEIAALLLDRGADAKKAKLKDGITALHLAAQEGMVDLVNRMLAVPGVDVNARSRDGRTPLFFAAQNDHVDVVQVLASHGAGVDRTDNSNRSPLWEAAFRNAPNAVRELINLGADPNLPMIDSGRPIHAAAFTGADESIRVLVEHGGVDVNSPKESTGFTPLHFAAQEGNMPTVRILLELGANARLRNKNGETAADRAGANGHFEIVRTLARAS